jgi:hypothetical protein
LHRIRTGNGRKVKIPGRNKVVEMASGEANLMAWANRSHDTTEYGLAGA